MALRILAGPSSRSEARPCRQCMASESELGRCVASGHERQGDAVHAIALAGGRRPVVEHVAEMAAAAPAMHFGAGNEQRAVHRGADGVFQRRREARPAGAALELGVGGKQGQLAARAGESSRALLGIERARERLLGSVLAQHAILRGVEDAPPLVVAFLHLERSGSTDVATAPPAQYCDHSQTPATEKHHPTIDHACLLSEWRIANSELGRKKDGPLFVTRHSLSAIRHSLFATHFLAALVGLAPQLFEALVAAAIVTVELVADRIAYVVVLVIVLRLVERACRGDLGLNRLLEARL